ncbi:hypothetical protein ZYGR_0A04230 [Zygosaccharomyces rouxii]|uniref:ZYRO0A09592p n=2 Tax=Zygosaccharomyces rouxii TaxID=4956 RepID=C5DQ90_ZYGRC|nr:uncharacterized protein ZYRO0A09592g [Zygosaccharomyces rouxii]KAH9198630.1 hypothetical protein LQ764DRAFT_139509 [Zygosaccharomyces rouxii]GAV46826.1 hypothetical protein ZYGR_0A04230 [Zygosaccharomyces rouxii]CAR25851.1 ZYRO0A09592p [Zygosaccharomyces rouxii]
MELDQFPLEILWKLLLACPLELRLVNRKFYHLHNELYREKTLQIVDTVDEEERFWSELKNPIASYIKSLDFLRKDARMIYRTSKDTQEFIDDSWFIIYSALSCPLKCWNSPALCERDSLDMQKPIYAGECVVPVDCHDGIISTKTGRSIPLNAWFFIDKPIAASKVPGFVTEIRQSQYGAYKKRSTQGNVADFIKERGVYCFNLGDLPDIFLNNQDHKINGHYFCPFEIRLVEVGMAPPTYFENSEITFLGYDFNSYGFGKPWILFKCDRDFEASIFNPFESYLAESLAKFTGAFPFSHIDWPSQTADTGEESIEPYFDPNQRAMRHFVYRFPRAQQDWNKERTVADWRAPHLIQ